jgi:uncharacterized protein with PIN domain
MMASATDSTLAIDLVVALAKLGEIGLERTASFLDQQAIATLACDQDLADAAAAAFQRFGRGRHPNDFSRTGLRAAL